MKKRFYSRVDPFFYIPVTTVLGGTGILMMLKGIWQPLIIIFLVILFIAHMIKNTWYETENGVLTIKCGFFFLKKIPAGEIKSIKPSRNPLSSPAFSLDRLEIKYNKSGYILVSPKDKAGFISSLKAANPEISVQ